MKLSSYGVVNPLIEAARASGIVKDHRGEMMIAYSFSVGITCLLEAELKALHQGVFLCIKNGYIRVIIEGSCLILVESLKKAKNLSWEFMQLWSALIEGLKAMEGWEISLCMKSQNKIADQLAKMDCPRFTTFDSILPPSTNHLYLQEKDSITSKNKTPRVEEEVVSFGLSRLPDHDELVLHQLFSY